VSTPQRPAQPDDNNDRSDQDHSQNDGQGDAVEPAEPSRPGRAAYRRGSANPNGSTSALRSDVLGALGVLKVATADQLQRLLRPGAASNKAIRQALGDLALHGLVASDGNTKARHKTWRLEGTAGLEAAGHVLGLPRSDMGSTARGAGRSGAQHAMAVNETIAAFILGGTADGAPGGVGTVADWATEVEFVLPGGRRKVRPDAVWQAPEIGVPALMVEVDRSTMAVERVAAKFTAYRELFRTKVRDNDPALADKDAADRTVHWWRRTWPGPHTRPGYPPVALVVTGAGPVALANRQQAVADLARDAWGGSWWTITRHDNDGDGWREYDDAVPVIATTLEALAEHGPLGPVWWRYGREGRHSLLDALDSPDTREAYDERQKAREKKAKQVHRELMRTLACADCGNVPKQASSWEYGPQGQLEWTRRPGGLCWPCHDKHQQRQQEEREAKAKARLEAARAANATLRPCWTCRGSIGGKAGSKLELTERAAPDRLECPQCVSDREVEELGPLVLPAPTKREQVAALVSTPDDPWWEVRVLHAKLYPVKDRAA